MKQLDSTSKDDYVETEHSRKLREYYELVIELHKEHILIARRNFIATKSLEEKQHLLNELNNEYEKLKQAYAAAWEIAYKEENKKLSEMLKQYQQYMLSLQKELEISQIKMELYRLMHECKSAISDFFKLVKNHVLNSDLPERFVVGNQSYDLKQLAVEELKRHEENTQRSVLFSSSFNYSLDTVGNSIASRFDDKKVQNMIAEMFRGLNDFSKTKEYSILQERVQKAYQAKNNFIISNDPNYKVAVVQLDQEINNRLSKNDKTFSATKLPRRNDDITISSSKKNEAVFAVAQTPPGGLSFENKNPAPAQQDFNRPVVGSDQHIEKSSLDQLVDDEPDYLTGQLNVNTSSQGNSSTIKTSSVDDVGVSTAKVFTGLHIDPANSHSHASIQPPAQQPSVPQPPAQQLQNSSKKPSDDETPESGK